MPIRPFTHAAPGAIVFGPGSSREIAKRTELRKAARVLVVSDAGVKAAGALGRVVDALGDKVAFVDDTVVPDADVAHVEALAARAKEQSVDAIVAVGGGSVIDTAKGVAAVLATGKDVAALEGFATVRSKTLPVACVPTTAGTGSEATQFCVLKDASIGRKRFLTDLALVPALGVLDPELIVSLPAHVTAATAVDALTHAVEALASKMRNPFATALALEACRLIVVERALERSLQTPGDLDARGAMLVAATLAGQSVSSAMLGAAHGFAHALGAVKGVPHGVGNGLFLVPVMRMNAPKATAAYAALGRALGGTGDDAALVAHAIDAVEQLVHGVAQIPTTIALTDDERARAVDLVLSDPDLATNPVALTEAAVVASMLRARG